MSEYDRLKKQYDEMKAREIISINDWPEFSNGHPMKVGNKLYWVKGRFGVCSGEITKLVFDAEGIDIHYQSRGTDLQIQTTYIPDLFHETQEDAEDAMEKERAINA